MRNSFLIYAVLVCGIILVGDRSPASSTPAQIPQFSLPSLADGATVDSASLKGKAVLVNFWATWCAPCRKEIPGLIKLQKDYGEKGLEVISISVDKGGSASVQKVMEKAGVNYPVLMAGATTTDDFGGIFGIPASFLFDQDGNLVGSFPGYVSHQTLDAKITTILK